MDTVALGAIALLTWYGLSGLRAKERARAAGLHACRQAQVDFLDDTVQQQRLRLQRSPDGRLQFCRRYRFEFSSDGSRRYAGRIELCGRVVTGVEMEPFRIAPPRAGDLSG